MESNDIRFRADNDLVSVLRVDAEQNERTLAGQVRYVLEQHYASALHSRRVAP